VGVSDAMFIFRSKRYGRPGAMLLSWMRF